MKKIIISFIILFVLATPVNADNLNNQVIPPYSGLENKNREPIWGNEKERVFYDYDAMDKRQELRRIAGITWLNQEHLNIEFIDIMEDDSLFITIMDSDYDYAKEQRIRNFVNDNFTNGKDVTIHFNGISRLSESAAWSHVFFIADGIRYMGCEGKLMALKHTPYMKNGYLMVPLRDVCEILAKTTRTTYKVNWIGGKDEILEISGSGIGGTLIISIKNNQFRRKGDNQEFQSFEGAIENINGTIYLPYSYKNMSPVFDVYDIPEYWDEKTRLAVIFS